MIGFRDKFRFSECWKPVLFFVIALSQVVIELVSVFKYGRAEWAWVVGWFHVHDNHVSPGVTPVIRHFSTQPAPEHGTARLAVFKRDYPAHNLSP